MVAKRTWQVGFDAPEPHVNTPDRFWTKHHRATCICETAARAIELVMEFRPDAKIHSVQNGGEAWLLGGDIVQQVK
jgi:hypothetical protein